MSIARPVDQRSRPARGGGAQRRRVGACVGVGVALWLSTGAVGPQRAAALPDPFTAERALLGIASHPDVQGPVAGPSPEREVDLDGPEAWSRAATEHYLTGEYRKAAAMALAVGEHPDTPPRARLGALSLRAEALRALGDREGAALVFGELRDRAPAQAAGSSLRLYAALQLAELAFERGELESATRQLRRVQRAGLRASREQGAALRLAGRAAALLGRDAAAVAAFEASLRHYPDDAETLLLLSGHHLDHQRYSEAVHLLQRVIEGHPRDARAWVLLGRAYRQAPAFASVAADALERALTINPNLEPALVERAYLELQSGEASRAEALVRRVLDQNPHSLPALTVRAVSAFVARDDAAQAAAEAAIFEINPKYVELYHALAPFAERTHRYQELVELARRAVQLRPREARAQTLLGINLLRTGDDAGGIAALRKAHRYRSTDPRVEALLNLYRQVIGPHYGMHHSEHFEFRLHKRDVPVLLPYLPDMMERAYDLMAARYGVRPNGRVRVELFADERDFSLRTTGLPDAGVQGVCFGNVITAVSPQAGPFNWGQILWHELAHVFHLQVSEHQAPRWFTEGLAEYETAIARPEWKREGDRALAAALRRGDVPSLSHLDQVFASASSGDALETAYYTATLAVQYLVERYDLAQVVGLLEGWGASHSTAQVVQERLGESLEQLDQGFAHYLSERLVRFEREFEVSIADAAAIPALRARVLAEPNSADARARLALAQVAAGNFARGRRAARAALRLDPQHAGAHFALLRVYLAEEDMPAARTALTQIVASGQDSSRLRLMLAYAEKNLGNLVAAREHAQRAAELDPEDIEAERLRFTLAVLDGDRQASTAALSRLTLLDQHDRAAYRLLMADLAEQEAVDDLIRVGESAIYVDPAAPDVHLLLAEGYAQVGRFEQALAEFERAGQLGSKRRSRVELGRALCLFELGRHEEAQGAMSRALSGSAARSPRARRTAAALRRMLRTMGGEH